MWCRLFLLLLAGAASAEHFQAWKTNTEYQYEVRGRTISALHDYSDQYTGILLRALLTIQPKNRDTLQAKISKAQYAQIHTKLADGWDSELSDNILDLKQLPISEKVFEIRMKRGVVIDLAVDADMPIWEVNVLKSIVSQLQVDTQAANQDSSTYKVMEGSIGGKCEVLYNITSLSESILHSRPELVLKPQLRGDGEVIEILKTKDYCNCEQQVAYRFGNTESNNWGLCMDDNGKFLSRSSVSQIVVTGNVKTFTIQSSVVTQKVILSPNLNENKKGMVSSRVNVTLAKMGPVSSSSWLIPASTVAAGNLVYTYTNDNNDFSSSSTENSSESNEEQLNEAPSMPFFIGFRGNLISNSEEDPVMASKSLANQIGRDLENPNSISDEQTLEKFTILSRVIRTMSTEQIAEVERQIYQSAVSNNRRDITENVRRSTWLAFRDAVAQAGTGPALVTIKNWIKDKKLKGLEAVAIVGVLSKTSRTPTSEYIKAFFEMVTMPEVINEEFLNSTAMITFAELIRSSQFNNDTVIYDCIPYMSKQLEQSIENGELAKSHVFIHALGTLADPRILTIFEPYIEGKILASTFQRLLMVFSINKLASLKPEMARGTFYKIYHNVQEVTQLRCAAVAFLMSTNPPASMLQSMAILTNYDNNTLVNAIVKSAIESASKLEAPESQNFAASARNVLPLLKKDSNDYETYMNYFGDHPESDLNLAYRMHAYMASDANIDLAFYASLQEVYNKFQFPKYEIGEILSGVKDLYAASSKQFKTHNKETRKKNDNILFSPENIAKLLKIESKDNNNFEGAIWMNSMYINQFISMDQHNIRRIIELFGLSEIASLGEGQNFNVAQINSYDLTLSFPLEFGFPFLYTMKVPSMLKYSGFANGEIAPDFVKGAIDVRVVYSMQIQARLGFITPFDNQHYMAGVNKNLHMYAPVRAEFNYQNSENRFTLKLQPIEQNEKYTLVHYSVVPFTSRHNILDLSPVINDKESRKIINDNLSHRSGRDKNLEYYMEFDSNGGYKDNSNWETFARGMFTLDEENHVYDRIEVYWDPDQSSEQAVILTSSLDTLHDDTSDYDESTSKTSPKATAPWIKSKKLNDPERRRELMKEAAKGIAAVDAFALDLGIEVTGNETSQMFMSIAYASSKVDPKSRGLAYWRVANPQSQAELESCVGFESRSPRSSVFTTDVNFRDFDVDLHSGPTCENAIYKIQIHGEQQRTEQYKKILFAQPILSECMAEVMNGAKSMPACQDSSAKSSNLDKTHMTFKFDSKIPGFREGLFQMLCLFTHVVCGKNISVVERTSNDATIARNVLEFNMHLNPYNNTANISCETSDVRLTAQDIEIPFGPLIVNAHPDLSVRELFEMKVNTVDSHQRMCVFENNWASTFDRSTYPIQLGNCWHVAMTTYPKTNKDTWTTESIDEDMSLSVLVRDAGDMEDIDNVKKTVQIILGRNQLNFTMVDSKIHVTLDEKAVDLNRTHRYRHRNGEDIDFELLQRPDGSVRLSSSKYGVDAFYDGTRIQMKIDEKYHNGIRGLCGNYDGNAVNDFTNPKGCVLSKSDDFVGTYALTSSDCQGPALENSKKAKDAVCNR